MTELIDWAKAHYGAISTIVNATATFSVAVLTFFLWRLQRQSHAIANYANVRLAATHAQFDPGTKLLRIEILLINTAQAPAMIQAWKLILKSGNDQEDASKSKTVKSTTIKATGAVQGTSWILKRESPLALAVEHAVTNPKLGVGSNVFAEVTYAGGRKEEITLKQEIKVS